MIVDKKLKARISLYRFVEKRVFEEAHPRRGTAFYDLGDEQPREHAP
jgi:hypothetical protein